MKKFLKIILFLLLGVIITPFVVMTILYLSADMGEPQIKIIPSEYVVTQKGDSLICKDSYLRYDSCGVWELYVEGSAQERGAKQGALTKDLMKYQEDVFVDQINEIVPSNRYLSVLRVFIIIFNRNLGEYIPEEYRDEIAAMAQFCTNEYNAIGSPYERQLNYHAAHDIGHTMQQYMLVGCSSFGVWGNRAEGGNMIIGRNFDFYVGDDFAKNKLITFAVPHSGYRYASVGWAGMIGVLSGMNECGLTVTINAAKGAIPTSAATPISILTREILQYASNIDEAYEIAKSRHTFVSESIFVGSEKDGKSAIIEKTPTKTSLYMPLEDKIISTNHFQSDDFAKDSYNVENIANSDSQYRYDRLEELIDNYKTLNYKGAVEILRDRHGLEGKDIGVGNEMTLNQSIAHHSVVFVPKERRMWVSTTAWQSGKVVCYDLGGFFDKTSLPLRDRSLDVMQDSVFMSRDYPKLIDYRKGIKEIKTAIKDGHIIDNKELDEFVLINPNHYYTYRILGDYFSKLGSKDRAIDMYARSLKCDIPYSTERVSIEENINKLER